MLSILTKTKVTERNGVESKCPTTSIYIDVASTSLSQLIGKGWDAEFRVISVPFRGLIPGLGSGSAFRVSFRVSVVKPGANKLCSFSG